MFQLARTNQKGKKIQLARYHITCILDLHVSHTARCPGVCLKIHFRHLHAPLRGRSGPDSVSVAHYVSFIGA
ncbi:DUF6783 domain-containing protein [Hungatella hathewayi]|uniref:DUF6783 domain-containing protein n=1 Tax=Hungatella hathewayi TaxID=154046 RepID=UPI00356A1A91